MRAAAKYGRIWKLSQWHAMRARPGGVWFILGQFNRYDRLASERGPKVPMKLFRLPLFFIVALPIAAQIQKPVPASAEARAAHALETAKKAGAPELYALLKNFPKGADLHMHLSGAIYAETFLAEATKENLCIDPEALAIVAAPCRKPVIPAAEAIANQKL